MFSVIFPGQGSQSVGMCRNLYNKYDFVKELFTRADEILGYSISKLILELGIFGTKISPPTDLFNAFFKASPIAIPVSSVVW